MYDIPRIMFKVYRFLNYQGMHSKKNETMLTSLILLFDNNKVVSVGDVYEFSRSQFGESLNLKTFVELIKTINFNIEPQIIISKKNNSVYFEMAGNLISSINHYNFGKLANYEQDRYALFDFRENVELYLYSIESHSEKREAMLTALIKLAEENSQVSYNNVVFFSEEYFDLTLGITSFNSFILHVNKYSKSDINITKLGRKTTYSELTYIENTINEYKLPKVEKTITRERDPIDLSIIRRNNIGEYEINPLLLNLLDVSQLKIEDSRIKATPVEIHKKMFSDIHNLLVNHKIYTDKRASMLASLVILLKSNPIVELEMIRDLAVGKFYGALKSVQFNKFLKTFNRFSPSAIEIDKAKYTCRDLVALNDFIETHRSKAIQLTDLLNVVLENPFLKRNNEDEKIMELIAMKDSFIRVGDELLSKIMQKYVNKNILHIAASKLQLKIVNDKIELETELEQLYLIDFLLNDIYFKMSQKVLNKFKIVDSKYLNLSTNLIERYKILMGANDQEQILIDQMLSSRLSIFEIVEINPPLLKVKDLLNSNTDSLETVIDRNLSKTAEPKMIWGFRLMKVDSLGSTSGVSFLFSSSYKNELIVNWKKIAKKAKKSKRKRKSQLLFVYLFNSQRKFGLNIESEIFL